MIRNLARAARCVTSKPSIGNVYRPHVATTVSSPPLPLQRVAQSKVITRSYAPRTPLAPQKVEEKEMSLEDKKMHERDQALIMKYIHNHPELLPTIHATAVQDKINTEQKLITSKSSAETDELKQKIADLEATVSSLKVILEKKKKK